jgi:hypothetical protein
VLSFIFVLLSIPCTPTAGALAKDGCKNVATSFVTPVCPSVRPRQKKNSIISECIFITSHSGGGGLANKSLVYINQDSNNRKYVKSTRWHIDILTAIGTKKELRTNVEPKIKMRFGRHSNSQSILSAHHHRCENFKSRFLRCI